MENVRVLVVDDSAPTRGLVARLLEREAFTAIQAGTLKEAELLTGEQSFDVVVLDIMLDNPEDSRTGVDFIPVLRRKCDRTKIILLTGQASLETAMRAVNVGAFGYIQKPVMDHCNALLDRVKEAVNAIHEETKKAFAPYVEIFDEIWKRTVGLVGPMTLSAIFRNVLSELTEECECLSDVVVAPDGVSLKVLLNSRMAVDTPERVRQILNRFVAEIVRFLADLTGEDDLRTVLRRPVFQQHLVN